MPRFALYAFGSAPMLPPHSKNPGATHVVMVVVSLPVKASVFGLCLDLLAQGFCLDIRTQLAQGLVFELKVRYGHVLTCDRPKLLILLIISSSRLSLQSSSSMINSTNHHHHHHHHLYVHKDQYQKHSAFYLEQNVLTKRIDFIFVARLFRHQQLENS